MEFADGAIALLGDDDFSSALEFGIVLLINLFAEDEHDHVGVLFDGAGFAEIAELRAMVAAAAFGARLSCESATTGASSSLARAFRPREMAETSCVRFSKRLLPPDMSWR